ncbi:hypothetical protein PIB30_046765 [Stylosanthes scabra]|uniref:Uncharacterized protein n=1 Tax=Stylosanthes scabra TaxID=79078 RepID=A0ABU6WEM4_9FABA|nr:hypothetical protein [Stylosanthes scabra]
MREERERWCRWKTLRPPAPPSLVRKRERRVWRGKNARGRRSAVVLSRRRDFKGLNLAIMCLNRGRIMQIIPLAAVFVEGSVPPHPYIVVKNGHYCGKIKLSLKFMQEAYGKPRQSVTKLSKVWETTQTITANNANHIAGHRLKTSVTVPCPSSLCLRSELTASISTVCIVSPTASSVAVITALFVCPDQATTRSTIVFPPSSRSTTLSSHRHVSATPRLYPPLCISNKTCCRHQIFKVFKAIDASRSARCLFVSSSSSSPPSPLLSLPRQFQITTIASFDSVIR